MALNPTVSALRPMHFNFGTDIAGHLRALDGVGVPPPEVERRWSMLAALARRTAIFGEGQQRWLDRLPAVLSHNDLSPENALSNHHGTLLIDFEMAAISKPDFMVGQLAVDASLDDFTEDAPAVRPFAQTWADVRSVMDQAVPDGCCQARTLERLVQNAAYGLRQYARLRPVADRREYAEFKLREADFCLDALRTALEELD